MMKTILIIEDDQDMRSELSETLANLDYIVQTASDGLIGKKLLEKKQYDVIILDLKMPKFDGYQLLGFIEKANIESKIIVITARMKIHFEDIINQNKNKNETDLLKRANFILLKPFKIIDLITVIKQ
jgi:two-component system, OmpR family, alkaline phosphatase synthesis response regulator PhoP